MSFLHNDLGYLNSGVVVEVSLDHAANVRLMDTSNFQNYRQGRQHRYFGGEVRRSPIRLRVPQSGHWHVAIDLGGRSGTIRAGVRVFT
jgi:hypothetical protein